MKSIAQLESDGEAEKFQDDAWNDECILAWFHARRGSACDASDITPADIDLLNRLKHFRSKVYDGTQNDEETTSRREALERLWPQDGEEAPYFSAWRKRS